MIEAVVEGMKIQQFGIAENVEGFNLEGSLTEESEGMTCIIRHVLLLRLYKKSYD